jgi:hypothetical protein
MKKTAYTLLAGLLVMAGLLTQIKAAGQTGTQHSILMDIDLPIGQFQNTHLGGVGLQYAWSNHRFSKNIQPEKLLGFTANGGLDYYLGTTVKVAGYDYTYSNYLSLHTFGGVIYNPAKNSHITLTAGPTLDIYDGSADAGFGVALAAGYYFARNIAFSPALLYMKHDNTKALWVASFRIIYSFNKLSMHQMFGTGK